MAIPRKLAATKEDIARWVDDMLELPGYACQLMADKLKSLEDELEELERLQTSVPSNMVYKVGL